MNLNHIDSGAYSVETSNSTAASGLFRIEYNVSYQSDLYAAESNVAAEQAMDYGLAGYEITAQYAAALADAYAHIAAMYLHLEKANGRVAA